MASPLCPFVFALATAALSAVAGADAPRIEWTRDEAVRVVGPSPAAIADFAKSIADVDRCASVFRVAVAGSSRPMLGTYRVVDGALEFKPRYKLDADVDFEATYQEAGRILKSKFRRESKAAGPPTRLVRIDPTAEVLPENLLRVYLTFSAPMSRGQVYKHARLVDEGGKTVELAFLEVGEELWDRSQTRLTLLFDPGRVKSGLRPREEDGPILVAGRSYAIEVDAAWLDAKGKPLAAGGKHSFRVGPPDTTSPDPARWKIEAPQAGGRDPLVVRFGETLDRALALRLIAVVDANGEPVEGEPSLDVAAEVWTFRPAHSWTDGEYRLTVMPTLEDVAGNSVAKPFEVDTFQVDRPEVKTKPVLVPFRTKGR